MVVGDIIFQKHKQIEGIIEIKNIRIHPQLRRRKGASFMLTQIESEMPYEAITVDARVGQNDVINLLSSQGYIPVAKVSLYDDNHQDVVMVKFRNKDVQGRIIHSIKSNLNLYN